ncbi:MAG: prepilin peptidase [Bacillota bacterium]|nr:prepilin peptidase [Bacillota bacterium]
MSFQEIAGMPFLAAYILIVAFFAGSAFGSFFNCWAWRIVHHESILHGRSHCPACGHPLGVLDLIPVFSWFLLHGKCRYCNGKISPRYVIAEILSGAGFVLCVLRFGLTMETARAVLLFCFLFVLSLVDLESFLIPDRFILAILALWAVTLPLILREQATAALSGMENVSENFGALIGKGYLLGTVSGIAVGGAILIISLIFDRVTGKESLGGGDIKLFFAAGLYLGATGGLLCVMVSCFIGLIFAWGMRQERIPFGPSISAAFMITFLFGDPVIRWYLSLLGV